MASRPSVLHLGLLSALTISLLASDATPQPKKGDPKKGKPAAPIEKPVAKALPLPPAKKPGADLPPAPSPAARFSAARWTAATPDDMVALAGQRASDGGHDALAGLLLLASLDERAAHGEARRWLGVVAAKPGRLGDDARWLDKTLTPEPRAAAWPGVRNVSYDAPDDASGLVKAFAILGPFQDNSGEGLTKREGPEAAEGGFGDTKTRYSWGVYEVAWRRTLPSSASARGLPLDLYVSPRTESCTYLSSKVTLPASSGDTRSVLLHVAATGAVRVAWDGADVAVERETHPELVVDRLALRLETKPGAHLLTLKSCSGAVEDDGRIRVRFTDEAYRPITVGSSSDLRGFAPPEWPKGALPAPAADPEKPAKKPAKPGPKAPAAGALQKGGKLGKKPEKRPEPEAEAPAATLALPKGVTRVRTSLEESLEVPEGSAKHALVAAISRTLGGGEDATSPRAPGLLDLVARSKPSPDELAIAGWVSPFGANRSGWLNQALHAARDQKDEKAEAFAQRRLAAAQLGSNFPEWALSTIEAAPLKSATDVEARLLRALAKKGIGGPGATRAAVDALLALEKELGQKTPLSILRELHGLAVSDPTLRLRLSRLLAERAVGARGASYVADVRAEGAATMEIAAAEAVDRVQSVDELAAVAQMLAGAGRWAWARELYYVATALGPNEAAAFHGLAVARRGASMAANKGVVAADEAALADQALLRARDLDPTDNGLKAELELRGGVVHAGAESRKAGRDEQFLPNPKTFLERAKKKPAKKGEVADRQLHWVRVVTYHPDKRVSQLMHYAREVVIEPKSEDERYEQSIPIEGDDAEIVVARVHKKDGSVEEPEEQASGGRPYVKWPKLSAGDVVEIAVRSWTLRPVGRRGDPPYYFIDYVGADDAHPVLYNEVVVDMPERGGGLAIDVVGGKPDRKETKTEGGRKIDRYVWDDPPTVAEEPFAPHMSEILPVVVGSTFANWGEFREWYRGAVKGFTEPDEQVKALAEKLTKGKKTQDEKLKALFEFVADDIKYVNYVSGEWWLPNRPQQLLARRQGDCDDKAMLLITLLRSVGIEATEVLVQTRYTSQPRLLKEAKVAIPMFDHGIAFLPGKNGKGGTWLDATSPESRLGPLPSMDARAVALFVSEGDAKIIDTPASSPAEHGVDAVLTYKLDESGAMELTSKETHVGDSAFELRMALKQKDARAQWLERYLSTSFTGVQIVGLPTFEGDLDKGAAVLGFSAKSGSFARREGKELTVPLDTGGTLTSELAPLAKRTLPVVLPPHYAPRHEAREITIVAPAGFAFGELPPGGEESGGDFGSAKLEFKASGKDKVIAKVRFVLDKSTITVAEYAAWRAWIGRVDRLFGQTLRMAPTKR